jgi:uncharacterized tellurite resistance protein B-like protein
MLFRKLFGAPKEQAPTASDELRAAVVRFVPGADAQLAAILGAVAGLCATVAHADRSYNEAERAHMRQVLTGLHELTPGGVDAICALLDTKLAELAHESLQTYTRVLYENLERSARLEVLDALLDLAAADEVLDMDETNLLRRIARSLGLSEEEYVASQARHRAHLTVLRDRTRG